MDVINFIPNYPNLNDNLLGQKILNKTEFSILDPKNVKVDSTYFRFQKNLGYLLSPYTPYNRMLVYYDVGVGKTCSAILVHQLHKQIQRGEFRPTILITSGPSLEQNFKDQFIRKCPNIAKEFTYANFVDQKGIKREVRSNFRFRRYGEFATYINGKVKNGKVITRPKTDDFIKREFSNRIFILDEGHILKNKGPRYKALMRVFDNAENITVLILTGTPLTESPIEGITLLNLLKRKEDRIKINESKFLNKYYDGLEFKTEKEGELLEIYKGLVTYLKQTAEIETPVFVENPSIPNTFKDFKTYNLEMSDFQRKVYMESLKEKKVYQKRDKAAKGNILQLFITDDKGKKFEVVSKEGGAFDKLALATSIFVFPDKTYGPDGFKQNLTISSTKKFKFKERDIQNEVVKNLEKYSVVFNEAFKIIENEKDRVFYIHFDTLNELHLFGLLLELKLKFKFWDGKSSRFRCDKTKPTYTKITQEQTKSKDELQTLLDQIGRKENADGSCIRAVLGSPVSGIGLTIPTATIAMVIGSQVSPGSITQIPNRINRPGSLKWVEKAGLPTNSFTYLFAATTPNVKSIDLHIYTLAQNKIILNTPQFELLKRADPFCGVSYERNVTLKSDNYKCAFTLDPNKDEEIWEYERFDDNLTDLLYWRQGEIDTLKNEMIEKVKIYGTINVTEFLDDYEPMIVYRAVKELSKERIEIDTITGEKGTVFIKGDLLFVDPTVSGDPNSAFYIQSQTFPIDVSLYDIMSRDFVDDDYDILIEIMEGKNITANFWKLSKYSQNFLWEEAWLRKDTNSTFAEIAKLKPTYEIDGDIYNVVWAEPIFYVRAAAAVPIEDPEKIRMYDAPENRWIYYGSRNSGKFYPPVNREELIELLSLDMSEEQIISLTDKDWNKKIEQYHKELKMAKNKYENQYKDLARKINDSVSKKIQEMGEDAEYGFYGFIDPKTNKFKIVVTGGKNRGRACSPSFSKVEHMKMFKELGLLKDIYVKNYDDPKLQKIQKEVKKGLTDDEIAEKLIAVKKFTVPEDFTKKDIIASIYLLLPGGISESVRCKMLQEAFKEKGILKEI